MTPQPAEALSLLNNKVVKRALSGDNTSEMEFRRMLNEAQATAPGSVINDIALVLVNGAWNRFDEADRAIRRAQRWSNISADNAYDLATACIYAWRPDVALHYMRVAADQQPGNPQFVFGYYKFSMLICATESMLDAKVRGLNLGIEADKFTNKQMMPLGRLLKNKGISEGSVVDYLQQGAEVLRAHFNKDPFQLLVTHPRIVSDQETGLEEVWFDFVLHTSPEKGAQIEWDLAFAEMPNVDDHVRDNIHIGVRLVDEFEDLNLEAEVVS